MKTLTAAALAVALLAAAPAAAEEPRRGGWEDGLRTMLDGLDRMRAELERLVEEMPRYAMPRVTEDGDIVIERLPPKPRGESKGEGVPI